MMYRHRPSYPALTAALCVIVLGACLACKLKSRVECGEGNASSLVLDVCLTVAIAGTLLIVAFARYKFTHLKTDRAFTKNKHTHRKRH